MARKKLSFKTKLSAEKSFRLLCKVGEDLSRRKTVGDLLAEDSSRPKRIGDALNEARNKNLSSGRATEEVLKKEFSNRGQWISGIDDRPNTLKIMWQGFAIKKTIHILATVVPRGNNDAVIILDARMVGWFDLAGHLSIPLRTIKESFETQRMV